MSVAQSTDTKTALVLGGSGKTGRRVAERLAARRLQLRVGSRSGVPPFDWEDRTTWGAALQNVASAYITYYPDVAVPGASDTIGTFARLAVAQGVRRLVLLSGRGEEGAMLAEQEVRESGAEWTILRSAWFNQNFSEGAFVDQVREGEVVLPAGDTPEPFVDADDIADVAVAALTEDGHAGQLYELTGPRLLTFHEAIAEIAQASGRDIRYVPVSIEEFVRTAYDVPADVIWLLSYLFTEVLDGRNAHLTDGVQRALGRAPRDFRDYARRAAASEIWAPAGAAASTAR